MSLLAIVGLVAVGLSRASSPVLDKTAPTIRIATPRADATVIGTVNVTGTAADDVAVARVEMVVDGVTIATVKGADKWSYSLDSSKLGDGAHTLICKAIDTSGNASSRTVNIQVHNSPVSRPTMHFAAGTGTDVAAAYAAGFNLFDISADASNPAVAKAAVDALPDGAQALVRMGSLDNSPLGSKCRPPGLTLPQFQAQVDALAGDGKVYGYLVADQPHPAICPHAAADISARTGYVHAHATGQVAMITVLDEYQALAPSNTNVDLVGLITTDQATVASSLDAAEKNGIPNSVIVPVYQTPASLSQFSALLDSWSRAFPSPVMDWAGWSDLAGHPDFLTVMKAHNLN